MTDEKFVYTQDVRDKKITARSARNKRTHNGKGGAVKFPSDYMTKKEINAMNGEVKSYRLNEPMNWQEFKSMPDDIKVSYIKLLRAKCNVSDRAMAEMFGIGQHTVSAETRRLGIASTHPGRKKWDKEGWLAFVNGVFVQADEDAVPDEVVVEAVTEVEEAEPITDATEQTAVSEKFIPCCGDMVFVGTADAALKTVAVLLGGANVRINIALELADNG